MPDVSRRVRRDDLAVATASDAGSKESFVAINKCTLPWTWLVFDAEGGAMPCCQARKVVGNLHQQTPQEIWNGHEFRRVRRALRDGKVPETCAGSPCPYMRAERGLTAPMSQPRPELDEEFAARFDDQSYLEKHPDVAAIVARHQLENGLDHYVHFGRHEQREHRLHPDAERRGVPAHARNLIEFSKGQTVVSVGPKDLVIGVTNVCNLRCVMCPHGLGQVKNPRHLDESYAEKLESFIAQATRVELVGLGEPMLAPLFWRLVELAKKYPRAFLRTNSNAHFLNVANVERLVDSTFSELSISLDAATPETYRKIRGSDLDFVRGNVRNLCRRRREQGNTRLEVTTNMILMKANLHEAVLFAERAAAMGADTAVYSQLVHMPTTEPWVVERAGWRFDYAEQMIPPDDPAARETLLAAQERCRQLGIKSQFILGAGERVISRPTA